MGLCHSVAKIVQGYLPGTILSLGYPDEIGRLNLKGSSLECVDLIRHSGRERLVDLSHPVHLGAYDLVLDLGTSEHVSNIAQSFLNAASAVKIGGRIVHHLPVSMVNHGYWNLNPCWFSDFYSHNGFQTEHMFLTTSRSHGGDIQQIPWPRSNPGDRFSVAEESLILFVGRRDRPGAITLPRCQSRWHKDA